MHKKGQTIITLLFILIPAILIWALALAEPLGVFGHQAALLALSNGHGFEAMLWDNLNLWVFIGMLLFTTIGGYILSNQ